MVDLTHHRVGGQCFAHPVNDRLRCDRRIEAICQANGIGRSDAARAATCDKQVVAVYNASLNQGINA